MLREGGFCHRTPAQRQVSAPSRIDLLQSTQQPTPRRDAASRIIPSTSCGQELGVPPWCLVTEHGAQYDGCRKRLRSRDVSGHLRTQRISHSGLSVSCCPRDRLGDNSDPDVDYRARVNWLMRWPYPTLYARACSMTGARGHCVWRLRLWPGSSRVMRVEKGQSGHEIDWSRTRRQRVCGFGTNGVRRKRTVCRPDWPEARS